MRSLEFWFKQTGYWRDNQVLEPQNPSSDRRLAPEAVTFTSLISRDHGECHLMGVLCSLDEEDLLQRLYQIERPSKRRFT